MRIDLTELLLDVGNVADIERSEPVSFKEDNLVLTEPVKIMLQVFNTGTSVLVRGTFTTVVELECSRCLENYQHPVKIELEEEFSHNPLNFSKGEVEIKAQDFVYPIEEDNTIDLTEVIRQNLMLALPMKTLCQPDCAGIKEKGAK